MDVDGAGKEVRLRKPRLVVRNEEAVYHCMSRTVAGEFLFDHTEKEVFGQRMTKLAKFCQILIQTHCGLSNHFHIVLKVPAQVRLTDGQLLKVLEHFYGPRDMRTSEFAQAMRDPDTLLLDSLRARYLARMGDLSVFMKELKDFFSKWFNNRHDRFGTLWAERFKSVHLPNFWEVIMMVAAYVDLNGVRAGLVPDPKDYRFCGYAQALARAGPAREGLASFLPGKDWEEQIAFYRQLLYCKGEWSRKEGRACLDPEEVMKVLKAKGKLTPAELLRVKVRYFSEGIALGTPDFMEEVFEKEWKKHCTERCEAGYEMKGADWKGWMTLRRFKEAFAKPKRQPLGRLAKPDDSPKVRVSDRVPPSNE